MRWRRRVRRTSHAGRARALVWARSNQAEQVGGEERTGITWCAPAGGVVFRRLVQGDAGGDGAADRDLLRSNQCCACSHRLCSTLDSVMMGSNWIAVFDCTPPQVGHQLTASVH
jgi:hypothetical protein